MGMLSLDMWVMEVVEEVAMEVVMEVVAMEVVAMEVAMEVVDIAVMEDIVMAKDLLPTLDTAMEDLEVDTEVDTEGDIVEDAEVGMEDIMDNQEISKFKNSVRVRN